MHVPFSRTYFDLLREQSARAPDELAVICGNRNASYAELERRASRVAAALRMLGVSRGDSVGLLINNRLEWLEVVFGATALGAVIVPLSTWSKEEELKYLIQDSNITVIFTLSNFGNQDFAAILSTLVPESTLQGAGKWRSYQFPRLTNIIGFDNCAQPGWLQYEEFLAAAGDFAPLAPGQGASSDDDLFILYTSGTEARPKAVRILHSPAVENGFNIGERQGLRRGDRVLLIPPLFWYYAAGNAVMAAITHAATLVLQPKFLPSEAIDSIENNKCTAIYTLPNITRAIIQHKTFSRSRTASLRTGLTIGTAEDVRLAAEILAAPHICNVYGLTETYGNCCVTWNDAPLDQRLNGQGPPLPGFTLRIVDPDSRHALKPGTVGEIEVSGRITPGYAGESGDRYNAATKTADGFFITGDLGFLDDDGHFHFVGRNTELIKTGGINVSPVEIETVLQQHDKISEAVVIGATSVEQGQEIVAFIVTRDGFQLDDANLRTYCRERMSTYKVPNTFVFVDSMPVTPTGKLSRKDLKAKWFSKHAAT